MALTKVSDTMTSGFGTMSDQNSSAIAVTGGTLSGVTITGSSISASSNTISAGAGAGIDGVAAIYKTSQHRVGDVITTKILIDLTGLNSGGTAGDIIGNDGTGAAYIGQVTAASCGTIFGVKMTCLEAPAGGDADIDLYSADENTGVEDDAITGLTETQIINSGTLSLGSTVYGSDISADQYLYLVGQGTSNATYTAGRLMIELIGSI